MTNFERIPILRGRHAEAALGIATTPAQIDQPGRVATRVRGGTEELGARQVQEACEVATQRRECRPADGGEGIRR